MRTIEITITPSGRTIVETTGFAGANCRQASAFIEQALGQKTGEQLTTEFYLPQSHSQHLQEGT